VVVVVVVVVDLLQFEPLASAFTILVPRQQFHLAALHASTVVVVVVVVVPV
jgi:hypothetical protein